MRFHKPLHRLHPCVQFVGCVHYNNTETEGSGFQTDYRNYPFWVHNRIHTQVIVQKFEHIHARWQSADFTRIPYVTVNKCGSCSGWRQSLHSQFNLKYTCMYILLDEDNPYTLNSIWNTRGMYILQDEDNPYTLNSIWNTRSMYILQDEDNPYTLNSTWNTHGMYIFKDEDNLHTVKSIWNTRGMYILQDEDNPDTLNSIWNTLGMYILKEEDNPYTLNSAWSTHGMNIFKNEDIFHTLNSTLNTRAMYILNTSNLTRTPTLPCPRLVTMRRQEEWTRSFPAHNPVSHTECRLELGRHGHMKLSFRDLTTSGSMVRKVFSAKHKGMGLWSPLSTQPGQCTWKISPLGFSPWPECGGGVSRRFFRSGSSLASLSGLSCCCRA